MSIYFDSVLRVKFNAVLKNNETNSDNVINKNVDVSAYDVPVYIEYDVLDTVKQLCSQGVVIEVSDGTGYWELVNYNEIEYLLETLSERDTDLDACEVWYTQPATVENFRKHDFTLIKRLGLDIDVFTEYTVELCAIHQSILTRDDNITSKTIPFEELKKYYDIPGVVIELYGSGINYNV